MTYELAKELKDAGFPQESDFSFYDFNVDGGIGRPVHIGESSGGAFLCSAPTLSELIDACRPHTFRIFVNGETGKSTVDFPLIGLEQVTWYADIDEAVARFWLSNKHE